jgi:sugar phosphate isomerase/epimerase
MSSWCKLSILTDEVSQDLAEVIRFAKEFQLPGIEVRSLNGKAFKDLAPADHREIRQRCDDAGLKISGVATPVFKCDLDSPEQIAAHVELFRRSVEAAQILGCEVVRVFAFLRRSHPATAADLERAASHFPKLLEVVKGTPAIVGIENEGSCVVATGSETKEFLRHLPKSPQLGVVWDPCNVIYLDDVPDPVHHEYPLIADRVVHFHVKDAKRNGTKAAQTCVEVGKGDVDFPAQLSALKENGYHGWVTLETHWRGETKLDDDVQHLPAGYSFSANAEPASRICMGHLQRLVSIA